MLKITGKHGDSWIWIDPDGTHCKAADALRSAAGYSGRPK